MPAREGSEYFKRKRAFEEALNAFSTCPIDSDSAKFDEFESGQFFHGHEKIALDSSVSDASYLAEAIGGEIFRAAGVPAVRVTFARVDLNGRDLGLYVIAQTMNRDYATSWRTSSRVPGPSFASWLGHATAARRSSNSRHCGPRSASWTCTCRA